MPSLTTWDLGGCNCEGCVPCAVPFGNLTGTHFTGTVATIPYDGFIAGAHQWSKCLLTAGAGWTFVILRCRNGCSYFRAYNATASCGTIGLYGLWESTSGCSTFLGGASLIYSLTYNCGTPFLEFRQASGFLIWRIVW